MLTNYLPTIEVQSLVGSTALWPDDLDGALNVVVIAYQIWHQDIVNSWSESFVDIKNKFEKLEVYNLFVVGRRYRLLRRFIDNGIKRAIQNSPLLSSTFTCYTNVASFKQAIDASHTKNITVLLVNHIGYVLWSSGASFDAEQLSVLNNVVQYVITDLDSNVRGQ